MIRTLLLCLLSLAVCAVDAAFSLSAHWKLDYIRQNYAGTWCFYPALKPAPAQACRNSTLTALLDAHIKNDYSPGLSIAYYDIADASALGGAGWADWGIVVLPVGVCMSGAADALANTYTTTCRFAMNDDDHKVPSAHSTECTVNLPQLRVVDGCYTPPHRPARFRLDDSASGILTIIGLIIALPSIAFGAYRWYCARRALALQQAGLEEGQALALMAVGRRDDPDLEQPHPEATLPEG